MMGLRGFTYQSPDDAVRRAEVKTGFECDRLCQISSCGKSIRQAWRSHWCIVVQSGQHIGHESRSAGGRFQGTWYVTVGKDAIVHLTRRCATEGGLGS